MAISFQQASAMGLDSVQIGFVPPAAHVTENNVLQLVAYAHSKGFDFIVSPINSPAYRRVLFENEGCSSPAMLEWRAGMEAFKPEDLVLRTAERSESIVGTLSDWQDFDSQDPKVRLHSELALKQQLTWVSHLGLGGVMLPYPPSSKPLTNYGRVLTGSLSTLPYTACWIRIPCMDDELEKGVVEELQGMKSWERWNVLRNMAGSDSKLGVALELGATLPTDQVLDRWFAEPVKVIILSDDIFLTNNNGYPVLSKRHQYVVRKFFKFRPYFIVSTSTMPKLVLDEFSDDMLEESLASPHADYIRYLYRTQDAPGVIDQFAIGYQDYLQAPLQPLQDNLESSTYETFEKDPIKYQQYELAVERALRDRPILTDGEPDVTVIMVVGAGRGPLVNCSLRAAEKAGRNVRLYAVEKNPNAFVTIQNMKAAQWGDRVNIVFSDMRTWNAPEKADILVSELLGSFGDNELSPECLDGAQKVLKPDGISIPANYTAFVAPMSSTKLHADVTAYKDQARFETSFVVMFKSISLLAQPKPIWVFEHPNRTDILPNQDPLSNHHNIRSGSVEFTSETSGMIHGVAGYFESVLYKDVMLSINPATHSPGMFSWFPIFFPIRTPLYVPAGAQVILDFWRLTDRRKVWYEWRVSCKVEGLGEVQWSALHNVGGRSSSIGLY
ncbi:MAG: PRMT5 arginine-N-methyltransferase-domain-containing protein [Benniella sp.]|nr:MAG: PRMT5 arginine-N-methyltransferase-domain-containing protein [Benniella sp.]